MKWLTGLVLGMTAVVAVAADESETAIDQLTATARASAIELDAKAEAALKKEIQTLTEQYLALIDAGDFNDAWLKYDPMAQGVFTIDGWIGQRQAEQERSGKRKTLDIWRTTVYKNPSDAPSPGNYIAVDYDSEFEKLPIVCGYVMWYQNLRGDLTIMREEKGYLTADMMQEIPAKDLPSIKSQIGCREES